MKTQYSIELLESRIAPAAVLSYTDPDGDFVTITSSKGTNADLAAGAHFDNFLHIIGTGPQLYELDLSSSFAGANITFTARRGGPVFFGGFNFTPHGDALVNVGYINAAGVDLGKISVKGDLGAIDAGSNTAGVAAIKSLSVRSMGRYGTLTQGSSGDLQSDLAGGLGSLLVKGDVKDAYIKVTGNIGPINISGSVIGGSATHSGYIQTSGDMGNITIGHDVQGGTAVQSGSIACEGKMGSVTLGGSLIGGSINGTGKISNTYGGIGAVKIAHDIIGGGDTSGSVDSTFGKIASVTVGGSVIGGYGSSSGNISAGFTLGPVKIGHDLRGGTGNYSGGVGSSGGILTSVTIGGSMIGISLNTGSATSSGTIFSAGDIGSIKIGHDFIGGSARGSAVVDYSGNIGAIGRIGSISIGGSVVAGFDDSSGALTHSAMISTGDDIGSLMIKGNVLGHIDAGKGAAPVVINARGQAVGVATATTDLAFGKIRIGGNVENAEILGGIVADTGKLIGTNGNAQIGSVKIGGAWIASNMTAGVENYGANGTQGDTDDNQTFGDANDHIIGNIANSIAKIASITIGGILSGTPASGDHFAFTSHQIVSVRAGEYIAPLSANTDQLGAAIVTADVMIKEL